MNINDVLALVKAGFTADQIVTMMNPQSQPQDPAPDPAISTPAGPEPAADPEPAPADPTTPHTGAADPAADLMAAIDRKFEDLTNSLRGVIAPSMDDIKPQGIDDIIKSFFKED